MYFCSIQNSIYSCWTIIINYTILITYIIIFTCWTLKVKYCATTILVLSVSPCISKVFTFYIFISVHSWLESYFGVLSCFGACLCLIEFGLIPPLQLFKKSHCLNYVSSKLYLHIAFLKSFIRYEINHLKWTIQWHLEHSQCCAIITAILPVF